MALAEDLDPLAVVRRTRGALLSSGDEIVSGRVSDSFGRAIAVPLGDGWGQRSGRRRRTRRAMRQAG